MKPAKLVFQKPSHNPPSLRREINHRRVALVNTALQGTMRVIRVGAT